MRRTREIKCDNCGRITNDNIEACPFCGEKFYDVETFEPTLNNDNTELIAVIIFMAIGVLIAILMSLMSSNFKDDIAEPKLKERIVIEKYYK